VARIRDEVEFATKPDLAQRMIARALAADLPFGWVTADEAYGQVGRQRSWLEEHRLNHVLAVPKTQMVISMDLRQAAPTRSLPNSPRVTGPG
jgi:SRSO17 transposase